MRRRPAWIRPRVIIAGLLALAAVVVLWSRFSGRTQPVRPILPEIKRISAIRFDASYFHDRDATARELAKELAQTWAGGGINTVYFRVYDPRYGARYRTDYTFNQEESFGTEDLLGHVLEACNDRGIEVFAWLPCFTHRGAWEAKPEWRVQRRDGSPYSSGTLEFPLCARNPGLRHWYSGFLGDILDRYPALSGIDIAEPVVTWKGGEGCFCRICRNGFHSSHPSLDFAGFEWDAFRAAALTDLVLETARLARNRGLNVSLTSVFSAKPDGSLFTPSETLALSGFDLDSILGSPDRPEIISAEIIWQEQAHLHNDLDIFTPEWVRGAARTIRSFVRGRAQVVAHLELTDFGTAVVDAGLLARSIRSALDAGVDGIDIYDAFLAEEKDAYSALREEDRHSRTQEIIVIHDGNGASDARQVATLLGHFDARTTIIPADGYRPGRGREFDAIFYLGTDPKAMVPPPLAEDLAAAEVPVVWLNFHVDALLARRNGDRGRGLGFIRLDTVMASNFDRVRYRGIDLPRHEPVMSVIQVTDPARCRVRAWAISAESEVPYAVQSGDLWYFADLPTSYTVEGGHYLVFADLLHEIIHEDHLENRRAILRIEDVHPLTSPGALRNIGSALRSRGVPFLISLVPFYVNPDEDAFVPISDRPEFASAIRDLVAQGGTVVLHGTTHQRTGETATDYEYWDPIRQGPVADRSDDRVREQIERGIVECLDNRIFPLLWETPHYAASIADYPVFAGIFSAAVERRQSANILGSDQLLPYPIVHDLFGQMLLPENLGYVPLDDQRPEPIIEGARRMKAVRDGWAGFFFHPFCDLGVLEEIVDDVLAEDYTFADPRELALTVKTRDVVIAPDRGRADLESHRKYVAESALLPSGRVRDLGVRPAEDPPSARPEFPDGTMRIWEFRNEPDRRRAPAVAGRPEELRTDAVEQLQVVARGGRLRGAAARVVFLRREGADDPETLGLGALFQTVGVDPAEVPVGRLREVPPGTNLLVVPHETALTLTDADVVRLRAAALRGLNVMTSGFTGLSDAIGISREAGPGREVRVLEDTGYAGLEIRPPQAISVPPFQAPEGVEDYYVDHESGAPVLICGDLGDGGFLFSAVPLSDGPDKPQRFPYLVDVLARRFGILPMVSRKALEIYFDPGLRDNISVEDLIKAWQKAGVRTIHVAGWHEYPNWTYEYERLISLAHQNAMLVFLWLELPMVSPKFWEEHPEWRERTATGKEGETSWRQVMALTDPECLEAVKTKVSRMLATYEFDGVNLAELTFESERGPDDPVSLTPFHPSAREAFRQAHGFDPTEILDPSSPRFFEKDPAAWRALEDFRAGEITRLHREFLSLFREVEGKTGRQRTIVVTLPGKEDRAAVRRGFGVDRNAILALAEEFPFSVQVLDTLTSCDPGQIAGALDGWEPFARSDLTPHLFLGGMRAKECSLATKTLTGGDLLRIIATLKPALSSEDAINDSDWPYLSASLARPCREGISAGVLEIQSPTTVRIAIDSRAHPEITVDDRPWPAYARGEAIIPAGNHRVGPGKGPTGLGRLLSNDTRLVDLSGEILDSRPVRRGVQFRYRSKERVFAVVNREPIDIRVDGVAWTASIEQGLRGYAVSLPAGTHVATILTEGWGELAARVSSILLSSGIVAISAVAITLLLLLYIANRIRLVRVRAEGTPQAGLGNLRQDQN